MPGAAGRHRARWWPMARSIRAPVVFVRLRRWSSCGDYNLAPLNVRRTPADDKDYTLLAGPSTTLARAHQPRSRKKRDAADVVVLCEKVRLFLFRLIRFIAETAGRRISVDLLAATEWELCGNYGVCLCLGIGWVFCGAAPTPLPSFSPARFFTELTKICCLP